MQQAPQRAFRTVGRPREHAPQMCANDHTLDAYTASGVAGDHVKVLEDEPIIRRCLGNGRAKSGRPSVVGPATSSLSFAVMATPTAR